MHLIDGKPACLLVTENFTRQHPDGQRHYYPAFVKAFEAGFTPTDWDYGTDYKAAKAKVDAFNEEHGLTRDAMVLIVTTSMMPTAPIKIEDIFRANGEEYVPGPEA